MDIRTEALRYLGYKGTPDAGTLGLLERAENAFTEIKPAHCWKVAEKGDCGMLLKGNDIEKRRAELSLIFRDNIIPMITGKNVLILAASVTTGYTAQAAIEAFKYYDGVVPACGELYEYDQATLKEFADVKQQVEKLLDTFKFRDAQKEAMNLARIGNKYLADCEPWKVIKTDPERVKTILHISLQLVANLAIAFEPFLPFSSEKLRKMLNMETFEWNQLGNTDLLKAGHQLGEPALLFDKIEDSAIDAQMQRLEDIKKLNEAAAYKANPIKPTIAFEDFEKLDIRVGKVLECEAVPKMKKLLKFKIADGLENRTIISGIAQHYKPEELVGKQVLFIANLAPRQFKNGLVSEGMILSAENYDGTLAVTSLLKEVAPGSEVK